MQEKTNFNKYSHVVLKEFIIIIFCLTKKFKMHDYQ